MTRRTDPVNMALDIVKIAIIAIIGFMIIVKIAIIAIIGFMIIKGLFSIL